MKKFMSILLALVLILSMGMVALAEEGSEPLPSQETTPTRKDQDASFSKTYKITNASTSNPAETFTFTFTADHVTNSNKNLTTAQMPAIANATVAYEAGTATTTGLQKSVSVALSDVTWPGVGVYYYKVNETAGTTAGVTYDSATAWLKVTVAYDDTTNTYYTAFVTLSLDDKNPEDGITDVKTGGFTNEYSAGTLAISKEVTGNMGDKGAYFAVKVTLTGESGKTYQESYAVSGGSNTSNPTTIKIGTETTFYLKHEETITISNLPYGVTYTVVEDDYTTEANGAYDEARYNFSDSNKKIHSASDSVTITNNKGTVVDTGITTDSLPYVMLLGLVALAGAAMLIKRRSYNN